MYRTYLKIPRLNPKIAMSKKLISAISPLVLLLGLSLQGDFSLVSIAIKTLTGTDL